MTPKLELLDNSTLVVSPTQLSSMKMCARYWRHNYMYRRVRAGTFAARDGGSAWDNAMNYRYRALGHKAVTPPVEAEMEALIDKGFAGLELDLDEYRTPARYKEVVKAYNAHYKEEPFKVLAVQMPFVVEVGEVEVGDNFWRAYYKDCPHEWLPLNSRGFNPCKLCEAHKVTEYEWGGDRIKAIRLYWPDKKVRVLLHGILDLLVEQNRMALVVDTKTSNSWDQRRQAEYDNHLQMKSYAWSVPRIKPEAHRLGLTKDMTPDQLALLETLPTIVHGCMVNAVVIRKPYVREGSAEKANAKARTEFQRYMVSYSQERLEEWRADTLYTCEQALEWVARDHYPQSEKHCAYNFGKQCPYWDVCKMPKEQREMVLGSDLYKDYNRGPLGNIATITKEEEPA